jgi:hypothetical protein
LAQKYRPLRAVDTGPRPGLTLKEDTQITYSRVTEGLDKLIARISEVRGMSDVVRESLTRDVPKDSLEVEGKDKVHADGPVFEQLARMTLDLSREIERIEKNMALSLAVLK